MSETEPSENVNPETSQAQTKESITPASNSGAKPESAGATAASAATASASLTPDTSRTLDIPSEAEGAALQSVGPYRLVKKLGEGGMGQVWLAEQIAPVKRQVALKLIKGARYDSVAIQRFEAERQSLAMMDHPAIAKVFDAGSTADGQPYFVMEYVPGRPITRYCDEKKLKVRERLDLFAKVCEGVQHAHQKAIMHRDLKPSNILVVEVDGKATPRIIDFGIAKGISSLAGGDHTMFTQVGAVIGTPGFMSPEQADPSVLDVDTRTDVYSLGVVLYVLLSGMLPFDSEEWKKKPIDEVLRQLREDNPLSPSAKVNTQKKRARVVAERRGTEAKQLVNLLRGDLDWITMKAVEKERARRYGTPSEIAADIERYLDNRPVVARPASAGYRLKKYVQRHRVGVAVAAGAAGLLVAFAVMQGVQLRRITRERDRANRVSDFMISMFKVSNPGESRGASITAREILDKASKDIDTGLAKDPELQAKMMNVMGTVYETLGLYSRAQPLLERTVEIQSRILGPKHPDTLDSMHLVAWDLQQEGHYAEAEKLERDTLELMRQVRGPTHPDTFVVMMLLGQTLESEGHLAEAEKCFRDALDAQRRALGADHPLSLSAMRSLCWVLRQQGKYPEAEKLGRETLVVEQRVFGPERPETLATMDSLGTILEDEGHYDEAEKLFRESLAIDRRVLGPEHPSTLGTMTNLGSLLQKQGRYPEAEILDRDTLEIKRRVLGPEHPEALLTMNNLASILLDEKHYGEAEKQFIQLRDIQLRVLGPEHPYTLAAMINLGSTLEKEGHYAEAEKLDRETLGIERRIFEPGHPYTLVTMSNLGSVLAQAGKYSEAEKLTRETLAIERQVVGPEQPDTSGTTYSLACVLAREGKRNEALSLLREAVDHGLFPATALGMEKDSDLKSLHGDSRFAALVADAKERAATAQKPK